MSRSEEDKLLDMEIGHSVEGNSKGKDEEPPNTHQQRSRSRSPPRGDSPTAKNK